MSDQVRIGLIVAGIATLVFGFAAGVLWLAERLLPSRVAKADASPLMRLWTEDKLLFVSIVVVVGVLVYSAPWAIDSFHTDGWRSVLYLVILGYVIFRLIQIARRRIVHDEIDDILEKANQLEKTNPAAALDLLDSFFTARYKVATQQRAELWEVASHDRRAAIRLERLLKDELRAHELMKRQGVAAAPPEQRAVALGMVQEAELRTRNDLERVRTILRQLRP